VLRRAANIRLWVGVACSSLAANPRKALVAGGAWRQGWRRLPGPRSLGVFFRFEGASRALRFQAGPGLRSGSWWLAVIPP